MNVWAIVGVAALQSSVSVLVGLYLRRAIRLNRGPIERVLFDVEGVIIKRGKGARVNLRDYRKAVAAGTGSLLGGLLVYVESSDLDPVLGPLVPEQYRPLLGWGLGAVAVVAGVIAARNGDKPTTSDGPSTIEQPAPPATAEAVGPQTDYPAAPEGSAGTAPGTSTAADATPPPATSAGTAAVDPTEPPTTGPFWTGVTRGEPVASTSLVDLRPAPTSSPL